MADASEVKVVHVAPGKKDRSPNYPSIGPTEALRFGRKIWEEDKRNPVTSDMACQHMGYKAKNGASLPIIAALKRYGILTPAGDGVRISDDAHRIYLAPEEMPERKGWVKQLAMRPALFGEVLRQFPDGLPSDANLRFRLMQDWEFATPKAADNFIKSLRDAVAIAGVETGTESADTASEVTAEEPTLMQLTNAIAPERAPAPPPPARREELTAGPGIQSRSWDLGGGAVASLALPLKLSKKNVDRLRKYVEVLATEAAITWDDDEEGA